MAFHQPTRPGLQRIPSPPSQHTTDLQSPAAPQAQLTPDETQTWVLFSPADNTQSSYLSSNGRTLETAGRSRVSDFGSLDTNVRSGAELDSHPVSLDPHGTIDEDTSAEDDAELDSLDSHLPDFRAVHNPYADASGTSSHALPVLPGHDGMGSFRLDQPAPEQDMQDRLYAFERFNPARRISAQRDEPIAPPDLGADPDMTQRMRMIELWRLEQSQLLLDHIRKETRARRASHSSAGTRPGPPVVDVQECTAAEADEKVSRDLAAGHENVDWHDGSVDEMMTESGGFLSRLTRKLLQELVGIDDRLLSILFGESHPDEGEDLPRAPDTEGLRAPAEQPAWQLNLVERVARELGVLMNRVSHHPGAFSAYARMQRVPLPYAGLPVIPEVDAVTAPRQQQSPTEHDGLSAAIPDFQPTIPQQHQASPPDMRSSKHATTHEPSPAHQHGIAAFTQEEWERDLDINVAFRYLRSRFGSRSASSPSGGGTSHLATSSTQDLAAKAARVRAHHPLVGRGARAGVERRAFKVSAAPGASAAGLGLRHASSCASQSTRRSGRRSSVSSRHYWDIGGSLGTGSVIASNGPMGSWGEV